MKNSRYLISITTSLVIIAGLMTLYFSGFVSFILLDWQWFWETPMGWRIALVVAFVTICVHKGIKQ